MLYGITTYGNACNPITQDAKAGGPQVWPLYQPKQHSEALSQKHMSKSIVYLHSIPKDIFLCICKYFKI